MHSRRHAVLAVLAIVSLAAGSAAHAFVTVGVSITVAPPALPVYVQPAIPGPGYMWAPGYWAWGDAGYYWVPGTWVLAPQPGFLWTPGYWGWAGGVYAWHGGYWGPHVGFYGGVNYGFGYGGVGFGGGEWRGGAFFYNRSVVNVGTNVQITNVYNRTVVENVNHVSFNGGAGGVQAAPTAAESAYGREPHMSPVAAQMQHEQTAASNPAFRASVNHGMPAVAATARPGEFSGHGVVAARGATPTAYHPPAGGATPGAYHAPTGGAPAHGYPQSGYGQPAHAPSAGAYPQPHAQAQPREQPHAAPPRQGGGRPEEHREHLR